MSRKGLMREEQGSQNELQQQRQQKPVLDIFQPVQANQLAIQTKLNSFYNPMDFPVCGSYLQPDMRPIIDKKKQLNKPFAQDRQFEFAHQLVLNDGLFQHNNVQRQTSNAVLRLKKRIVRDTRQAFFQQNGQFVLDNQFYQEQMSKLANISFQQNLAINTFQKNAILCQRNNQKKSTPYELEFIIGSLWFLNHPEQNQQQKKFQEIRPYMKQLSQYSSYPTIPQLAKEIQELNSIKDHMLENRIPTDQLKQVDGKLNSIQKQYEKQVNRVNDLMQKIINGWNQIKDIRSKTGMETVPWRLNLKQYDVNGRTTYDLGLTPTQITDKIIGRSQSDKIQQQKRRQSIKDQQYRIKVYINDNEVIKSDKFYLQWPSFKVPFNQKFSIVVYSIPSSITVEVIKIGFVNTVIDTVPLAIPGNFAKTITSTQKRFATSIFAENGSKYRKGQQIPSGQSGMILYKIEWKGQGSKMPPPSSVSMKVKQQLTVSTQQDSQYQQLFDCRDPRLPIKNKRQLVQSEIIRGRHNLLPFASIQSTRHLLLKLKSYMPQLEKTQVPLLEQSIKYREDLIAIIQKQKSKNLQTMDTTAKNIYHPLQGIFSLQDQMILREIREILAKIQNIRNANRSNAPNIKYKITQEIIRQYIQEDVQSPIVVFLKNLFTQKRKLGPQGYTVQQHRTSIEEIQINLHMRSARNIPVRQSSFVKIRDFQQQQNRQNQMARMLAGNLNAFAGYGASIYNQQPNFNGNNMFIPGMMQMQNLNMGNRQQQVNYKKIDLQRVNSCVALKFKKSGLRTQLFQGPYPQWNQTLLINYNLKNQNMTMQKLVQNNEKSISLLIFDMIQESKPTNAVDELRVKKSRYFLGKIQIPFSFLAAVPTVSGLFQIQRPLVLFGYGIKKSGLFDFDSQLQQSQKTQSPDTHSFLNVDIFTEPLIDSLLVYNSDRKFIPGAQNPLILQRASDWLEQNNIKRYVRLWLNNVDQKSIFICRYLSNNIAPPPQLGSQHLIERCARFVSLIPKKFNCKLLDDTDQFHLTADQFLNIKMGQDHGILLCNYFNYIDKHQGRDHIESFLVIGKAFPYGKAIFVLRRDSRSMNCQIWDPYSGKCFYFPAKQFDTYCFCCKYQKKPDHPEQIKQSCPLLQIGCIVSRQNVYVNNQFAQRADEISFQLEEQKYWKPFLTQKLRNDLFGKGIESYQRDMTPDLYPKLQNLQSKLQSQLQDFLRQKMQTQRRTNFNPYTFKINNNISNMIRNKLLLICQTFKSDFRFTGLSSTMYDQGQKIKFPKVVQQIEAQKNRIKSDVYSDKNFFGFPINLTFTTKQDLWQKVAQTQLHTNEKQSIQFVLCVRCFEIACHVISVWIDESKKLNLVYN